MILLPVEIKVEEKFCRLTCVGRRVQYGGVGYVAVCIFFEEPLERDVTFLFDRYVRHPLCIERAQ